MEHCGMQVVYGDRVFDNVVAEVIGLPVGKAPTDPTTRQPDGKASWVVVASVILCCCLAL